MNGDDLLRQIAFIKEIDKKKIIKNGSTKLWDYAKKLIEDSVVKGVLEK